TTGAAVGMAGATGTGTPGTAGGAGATGTSTWAKAADAVSNPPIAVAQANTCFMRVLLAARCHRPSTNQLIGRPCLSTSVKPRRLCRLIRIFGLICEEK